MCEAFNSSILGAKEKPNITMLRIHIFLVPERSILSLCLEWMLKGNLVLDGNMLLDQESWVSLRRLKHKQDTWKQIMQVMRNLRLVIWKEWGEVMKQKCACRNCLLTGIPCHVSLQECYQEI